MQLTDCHIFASAGERLRDMDTRASLRAVIELIRQRDGDADLLLATGDLSQDGSADSYRYLAQRLDDLGKPAVWIPGNHDDPGAMAKLLESKTLSTAKRVLMARWQIVLLDSTLPHQTHGLVSSDQLDYLDACLAEYPDEHALVCLHHQPIDMDSRWIDQIGLRNAAELRARIATHANVRGVIWGHVHQAFRLRRDGIEWMSTPSTCVQFKPGAEAFCLDAIPPGYRSLRLHRDGQIESEVHRVTVFDFDEGDPVEDG